MLHNPAAGVTLPSKRRKSPRYLTHTRVATLTAAADDERQLMIEFLAYTGLRWGEAAGLRVRHLNMLRKRMTIEDNAVLVKGVYEIGTPKSGHTRIVPIPPHLLKPIAKACEKKGPDAFLFSDGADPLPYPHATSGWFACLGGEARPSCSPSSFCPVGSSPSRRLAPKFRTNSTCSVLKASSPLMLGSVRG